MEISVGFADKDNSYYDSNGYNTYESEVGKVYIPDDQVEVTGEANIRYEKHPWIEAFELDGIKPKAIKRTGYGTKDAKGFVQSLNTIYAKAYQEYADSHNDIEFFSQVTENFVRSFIQENETKMFRKFCGFTENMWREGNKEMHDIAINFMLPKLFSHQETKNMLIENATDEFLEYIASKHIVGYNN